MLISLVIFASLSVILFFAYKTIRSKNKAIEENHRQIKEQNDKMELLMKELHHRVKNNLQIVTNLLMLQSNRLTDEESKHAIRMGQQRIEAMALIHRSLYEQSNPKLINMQEYVPELLSSIRQAFGDDDQDVAVQLDVNVTELDVDVALPLGLIINEWVTNSFKHAFGYVTQPELHLLLHKKAEGMLMHIRDNGPGLPEELWQKPQKSFGLKLIKVLVKQLQATANVQNNQGAQFIVQIPTDQLKLSS
jgi:two-component sensor histidine kinase